MTPDINQYLSSMKKSLDEAILPALDHDAFAKEQATIMSATLSLLLDVQNHESTYISQEYLDISTLLSEHRDTVDSTTIKESLAELPPNAFKVTTADEQKALLPMLKAVLTVFINAPELQKKPDFVSLLDRYTQRQIARETSWLRKSGFIANSNRQPSIAETLAEQHTNPL
jgi:hypothetical protein